MSTIKRFESVLTAEDVLDVEIELSKGKVTGFKVNYRAKIEGEWHEVVRYDTRHGKLHIHRFWKGETERIEDLENRKDPMARYNRNLTGAREDLTKHWKEYRTRLERMLHGKD